MKSNPKTLEPYQRLETMWQDRHPGFHMVSCSSGTAALHLACEVVRACIVRPSDYYKILVPTYTMIACARAVSMAGLGVKLGVYDENLLLDTKHAQDMVQADPTVIGVMPVHIYGRLCDMDAIHDGVCYRKTVRPPYVIEDMSHVHGIQPHSKTDIACWSLYRNKIVGGEEGGIVGFRDKGIAEIARKLKNHGFTDEHDFNHMPRGCNYRLSNANALPIIDAIGRMQYYIQRRKEIAEMYSQLIGIRSQLKQPRVANWVYDMVLPDYCNTGHIVKQLNAKGIRARRGFVPINLQEEYRSTLYTPSLKHQQMMYLPINPKMENDEVEYVTKTFLELANEA